MCHKKVFLSGPIQGMEQNQSYRERLRDALLRCGYEPVDPWLGERVVYSARGLEGWREVPSTGFIERDLEEIDECDLFVAYLPRLSAGTCMELFYAKRRGKKTVVICQIENPSPWIIAHSDILLKTIGDLENLLRENSALQSI